MAYIDAERAKRIIIKTEWENKGIPLAFCQMIDLMPTADVVEVKHGKWKLNKDGSGICSECGRTQKNVWDYDNSQNFCGHCGAKMDGGKAE